MVLEDSGVAAVYSGDRVDPAVVQTLPEADLAVVQADAAVAGLEADAEAAVVLAAQVDAGADEVFRAIATVIMHSSETGAAITIASPDRYFIRLAIRY